MEKLAAELERLDPDPEVRCIVIAGSDEVFAAGADIKAMSERSFAEALYHPAAAFWKRLAAVKTPLIAAVSGWALGGGCELALACDMIVASDTAKFGQPEINLGIIPGGGGTQRLARVLGKQRAMEYVLTGKRFDAETARDLGLVNQVVEGNGWLEAAMELARGRRREAADRGAARQAGGARRRGDRDLDRPRERAAALRAGDGDRGPGRGDEGLPREARPGVPGTLKIERIGVVGAGTMGAGIAQIAALGGYETRLHDPIPAALASGIERTQAALAKGAERGRWSAEDADTASARVGGASSFADLADCDLVIEAAPEELGLKRELFAALAEACGPETILATNTSSLPVTAIAALVPQRERVVGMHFFNPPALMKLVEVVATADSSEEALDATTEVGRRMGRTPIRAKDSPGFIANRLARPFTLESLRMLAHGVADVETIDRVCRVGGGFRMGPFELIDLIGLDVNLSVARSFYEQGGEPERWRPSAIQEQLVAEGKLGRKSGEGFYVYEGERGREAGPEDDPATPEILPRLIAQIANEAAFALEEEVGSPDDMDTAMRLGFNWPLGPLEFADRIGAQPALALLEELRREHGEAYAPAPLLRAAAERGAPLREGQPVSRNSSSST